MLLRIKEKISTIAILHFVLKCVYHQFLYAGAFLKEFFLLVKSYFPLKKLLNGEKCYNLYFMHRGGGGNEVYVQNILRGKSDYILLRNMRFFNDREIYRLEFGENKPKLFVSLKKIARLNGIVRNVFIENLWGYKHLEAVLKFIANFSARIVFKVHDLYSLCYNGNMVKNNAYCGLTCNDSCSLLINNRVYNPSEWRCLWRDFFACVDEFVFFSQSTKDIFSLIYKIPDEKMTIKPHNMDYFKTLAIKNLPAKMNVGVFGIIDSDAKGLSILKKFAEFSIGKDYKICMNGAVGESNLDVFCRNDNFVQYGKYKKEDIYERLVSQKIGVVFFTSICPETFSYVVSELMLTGIPIACFDIGAQAEKIKKYPLGRIITNYSCESILDELKECYKRGLEYYSSLNRERKERGAIDVK